MIIMAESKTRGRQAWSWICSWEPTSYLKVEGRTRNQNLDLAWDLETSKPTPSDTTPPKRPCLLILPQTVPSTVGAILIQITTLDCIFPDIQF